jgi:type I restriction enzyme S subunit
MISEEEIPEHWRILQISDVIEKSVNGGTPKRSEDEYWGEEIPWLSSSEVRGKYTTDTPEESITQKGLDESSAKIWPKNTVLVAMYGRGTIGRPAITSARLSGNQAICGLIPDNDLINTEFLYYWLASIKDRMANKGRGATASQQNLNQSIITETVVPVPPLDEQKQIVDFIDGQLETIDDLETAVSILESKVDRYEGTLLAYLFAGQEDFSAEGVSGTPSNEDVPEHWDVKSLGEEAEINPRVDYSEDREKYPHVPMDGVSAETQSIQYFSERDSVYSGLAKFKQGDILFARITPCMENGKVALVDDLPTGEEMSFGSTEFAVVRPSGRLLKKFVYYYLGSPVVRNEAESKMTGATGRKRVPLDYLRNTLQIPIPPKDEQQKIIDQFEMVRSEVTEAQEKINSVQRLFTEYRASILNHAFRGELLNPSGSGADHEQRDDYPQQTQATLSRNEW